MWQRLIGGACSFPTASTTSLGQIAIGASGTLVLWEQMDRLLQDATLAQNREHFNRRVSDAV